MPQVLKIKDPGPLPLTRLNQFLRRECVCVCVCVCVKVTQLHLTLCDPMDCSPPALLSMGISTRILDLAPITFSRGLSQPKSWTHVSYVSCIADGFFTTEPPGKSIVSQKHSFFFMLLLWYILTYISVILLSSYSSFIHSLIGSYNLTFEFSVQFSHSVVSNYLRPHESQHARPPSPSPTPGVHSDSHLSSQWCHPAISSSVVPFSSCPQSLPASESFPMSQLFAWGGQSTRV